MKRKILISILIYFGLIVLIFQSCGPNKEQIAKQKTQDSLKLINAKEQKGDIIWTDVKHGYFIDIRDKKKYKVIKIGTQTWMAENLAYKTNNGCWAYGNDTTNVAKYGYLYDWGTAKTIAPPGWHLPTKEEWLCLYNYLGADKGKVFEAMKEGGSSGFNALRGGCRLGSGEFNFLDYDDYFWSSTIQNKANEGKWNYFIVMDLVDQGFAQLSNSPDIFNCYIRLFKDY